MAADLINLKARPKATPDRIQRDIRNSKLVRGQQIIDNDFIHLAETEGLNPTDLPTGNVSVPLNLWLEYRDALIARGGTIAVQLASDEAVEDLQTDLERIDIVVLPFVKFVDGRGYSHAHILRQRYQFKGEIRAVGDVHFDHLAFLARAGCDAFELPDGDDHQAALQAFKEFTEVYQPAADGARLIFSRRRAIH